MWLLQTRLVGGVIRWVVETFGRDVLVFMRDQLVHRWRRLFEARNILVLGQRQAGKSSLAWYLTTGKPFEVRGGEVRTPAPTALAAVVDKAFSVDKSTWMKLKRDVPGDLDLRDTWAAAIADVRPHGIIYLLDGRTSDDDLREEIARIGSDVLSLYAAGPGNLVALHLFLNFADQWARSPEVIYERSRMVADALFALLQSPTTAPALRHLRTHVSDTQLSPQRKDWPETERALRKFAADLVG